jgi:hypothetical protein
VIGGNLHGQFRNPLRNLLLGEKDAIDVAKHDMYFIGRNPNGKHEVAPKACNPYNTWQKIRITAKAPSREEMQD